MSRSIRLVSILAAVVAIVSIGAFFYFTRDIAAPSQSVQESIDELAVSSEDSSEILFRISQAESQAEFNIFEVLNGADKTVVGTTSEVAGDIVVKLSNPAETELGAISINARTFETDDSRRDNAIARFILQSEADANEFITFQPTSLTGMPESISVGDTLEFQITGNLTIAGVTNEVTFDVTAMLETAENLVGNAEAIIPLADFNLSVPDVPFVASVGDEVTLKLNFAADAVTATTES
jgi:polyisoprenoid-binding protein YceI